MAPSGTHLASLRSKLMLVVALALIPAAVMMAATVAETRRLVGDGVALDLMFVRNLATLAILGVLAFGGAWIAAEHLILRHVSAMVTAARRLANGDLKARTGLPAGDGELDELAHAFDEMAASLERQQEELREVDRLKTRILHTAAHELNTPLTPMKLQLYLLKTAGIDRMSEREQKAFGVLDRNVDRLSLLVSDMLDVSKLQAGRLALRRETVDLASLVAEAAEAYAAPARDGAIELARTGATELLVDADAHRVTQILYNLLGNAVKFTPAGGRVVIDARREGGLAVVRVTDSGIGIPPEAAERLFRPFSQAHDHMQKTRSGTGLGLFISRGLAEEHGGTLTFESPGEGRGTTFTLTLPMADAVAAAASGDGVVVRSSAALALRHR